MFPLMLPDYRVRQRDYLLEIAQALTQELDLDSLLGRILTVSAEMLYSKAGLIALRSEEGVWQVKVSIGLPEAFLKYLEPFLDQFPEYEDPNRSDTEEITRLLVELTESATMGQLSGVGLPLITRQKMLGVIYIFRSLPNTFSPNDRALLSSFANQAAIAVQNAMFYTQLQRENQRLDGLLDTAGDGIMILTPDLKIERANAALLRILHGISQPNASHSVSGLRHEDIILWAKPPQGYTLENAVAGGWPLSPHANLYVEGDLKRGGEMPSLPVGITYAPLMTPEGRLLNIIATVRDITRFRQAEELKSTFISIISHELKTPVALIKGYVSTIRRDDADWDRKIIEESLEVIEEEADRLSGLIENMLDASRLQAGGFPLKQSDVSLPLLAERVAKRFQTQTTEHHITTDFPPDFPIVLADETRIQQVLNNLISNAIKYAPSGEISIRGQVRPNEVILSVSDEGPGIAPEDIPHVFDRFYRAPDLARRTKGAGLGLYLARSIIEAHGGRMWVDTEVNRGARFYFSLPR